MEECTFKPKLQTSYNTNRDIIRPDEVEPRYNILYNKGKQMLTTRKDKSREQIEYEKHENEYKFKPDLEK
jgi:hypothetical protein